MAYQNTIKFFKQDDLPNCKHLQNKIVLFFSFDHCAKLQN